MAVTVSMINMKGGVGKTTVASQLCFAGAAAGLRVLAVKLAPQSGGRCRMNPNTHYLDLHLRVLTAQYGKKQVSEALSAIGDVDTGTVRNAIHDMAGEAAVRPKKADVAKKARRRPRKSAADVVREAELDDPEAKGVVERLACAYEDKRFLPGLRDVREFLESKFVPSAKLRSRPAALPAVVNVLSKCSLDELHSLDRTAMNRGGEMGIIADYLLGGAHK